MVQLPGLSVPSATVGAVPIVQHDPHRPLDRCTTPDGLGIAVYDYGGRGADLLLVHATGFCAEVLEPLAHSLRSSVPMLGTRPESPRPVGPTG